MDKTKKETLVSIVIPVYNEENYIENCLKSLINQSYKNFEVLVVDDGSTDNTKTILKEYSKKSKKIKVINGEHKGPGVSRNLGSKIATGEILVFVDADMTFDKDYIKNLTKPLREDNELIGTSHDYEEAVNLDNKWAEFYGKIRVDKNHLQSVFRAIRKKKFIEFGGFDPQYGYADDQTFFFKHGIRPTIAENSRCYHRNPESLKEIYSQSKWIGSSISYRVLKIPVLNLLILLSFLFLMPLLIVFLTIKKAYNLSAWRRLHHVLLFTMIRYFGTLTGLFNKIFFQRNIK